MQHTFVVILLICMFHQSRKTAGLEIRPDNVAVIEPVDDVNAKGNPVITFYVQIDADRFLDLNSLSEAVHVSHATKELILLP